MGCCELRTILYRIKQNVGKQRRAIRGSRNSIFYSLLGKVVRLKFASLFILFTNTVDLLSWMLVFRCPKPEWPFSDGKSGFHKSGKLGEDRGKVNTCLKPQKIEKS